MKKIILLAFVVVALAIGVSSCSTQDAAAFREGWNMTTPSSWNY